MGFEARKKLIARESERENARLQEREEVRAGDCGGVVCVRSKGS